MRTNLQQLIQNDKNNHPATQKGTDLQFIMYL